MTSATNGLPDPATPGRDDSARGLDRPARFLLAAVFTVAAAAHLRAVGTLVADGECAPTWIEVASLRAPWAAAAALAAASILLFARPSLLRGALTLSWCAGVLLFRLRSAIPLGADCGCLGPLGDVPGLLETTFLGMAASAAWDVVRPGPIKRRMLILGAILACLLTGGGVLAASATADGEKIRVATADVTAPGRGILRGSIDVRNTGESPVTGLTLWPSCECLALEQRRIEVIEPFGVARVPFTLTEPGPHVVPEVVVTGSTARGITRARVLLQPRR